MSDLLEADFRFGVGTFEKSPNTGQKQLSFTTNAQKNTINAQKDTRDS
jgi:hypothetical protein